MIDLRGAIVRGGSLTQKHVGPNGKFRLPTFGASVQTIVSHRGLAAERELIEFLGLARLMQIYDGVDPSFPEAVEIARILSVPITSFVPIDPGSMRELDIAYAELLYAAAPLSPGQRAALAAHVTDLAEDLRTGKPDRMASAQEQYGNHLNEGAGHE
ncbi:hypothetical protein X907_0255 [Glycocaulis alkaliphilus]|uniref:Uncharacterized protein n=1 Tax=Glycocaulis alkaliphilus TaxID=1434191 RepID=A0A3T0E647_9PROT|nr:hypothetical protein X907_0255 [Glycocaulis alkaliphilus]GGB85192.1 hypothetical protein GCM10007417_26520 [Glycocaulis alkaliphilus]